MRYSPTRFCVLVLAIVLAAAALPAFAAETAADDSGAFAIEDFLQVPYLGSLALSPDGDRVAYMRGRRDLDLDKSLRQVWLADLDRGEPRRLTFDDETPIWNLAWRPGGGLSYIAVRDGAAQVWVNPLDGTEPRAVTDLDDGVDAFWWSPDGKYLAVLSTTEPEAEEAEDAEAEADDEADDEGDWTVFDRLEQPDEFAQLWIVAAGECGPGEADPRRLTEPPLNPQQADWSPDGATIALTYNERFSGLVDEEQRVGLIDVATGELTRVSPADRHASMAAFSPDGKKLAYFVDRDAEYRAYLNLKDLVVRDLAGGDETVLTPGCSMALSGTGSTPGKPAIWTADGKSLLISAADGTTHDLYLVDARKGGLKRVTELAGNVGGFDYAGGKLVYLESELHRPGAMWARKLKKGAEARRIDGVDDAVAAFDLRPAQKVVLPGADGGKVEGFLFLPPGAGETDRLPAIVEMHGGPYYRYGNAWSGRYPWQVLSQKGYAVLIVNPRGGTAYGAEFLRGVHRNFGTDDFRDIDAAIDALAERGTIDPDRLGFTGYSYGGLMTNVVVSRTDRFKAAVSIAGIWNYVSAMGQSNPQLFIDSYDQPWAGDLDRMWEHSPASRAADITTPTLVMHGTEDRPVDPRQSIEMFSYLQFNGVPSRLVLYPGEGHGINKPSHMIDYQTRELQWFDHYVLGDEEAEGACPPVPVEETVR